MLRQLAVAVGFWPVLAATLCAQTIEGWHSRTFTSRDGLAQSWVAGVTRGPSGRLFISHGAANAVSMFDGYAMTSFPSPGPALRVVEGPNGEAWASARAEPQANLTGVQWFDGGTWRTIRTAGIDGQTSSYAGQISALASGRALVLAEDALLEVDARAGTSHVSLALADTGLGRFLSLVSARDGGAWVSGRTGVVHVDPRSGRRREWKLGNGLADLVSLHEGRPGDLWGVVSTRPEPRNGPPGKAVVRLAGTAFEVIARSQGEPTLTDGWPDPDGGHWLLRKSLDRAFLSHVRGGVEREASAGKVLSRRVNEVLVDADGAFWLAAGLGLARVAPAAWREPPGLPLHDGHVAGLVAARTALYALHATGLLIRHDGAWTRRALPAGRAPDLGVTEGLALLDDGRLAVQAMGPGLLLYDPRRDHFEDVEVFPGRWILGMTRARDGGLWLASTSFPKDARIDRWDGRSSRTVVSSEDLAKLGEPRSLLELSDGTLWIGGISGAVARFSGAGLAIFGPDQGYVGGGAFSLLEIGPGRVWLGESSGMRETDGTSFSIVRDRLETVRSMVRAKDGAVWAASGGGLHRFKDGSWLDIGMEDGLPDAGVYELMEDEEGRIWVGTTNGLRVQDPKADRDPPRTALPGRAEGAEVSPRGDVQFVFAGQDRWQATSADRLLFSHRLDGGTWSGFETEPGTLLRGLVPGQHRLEVRAMDRAGNVDPGGAAVLFKVLLPWYREPAVLALGALVVLALTLSGASLVRRYTTLDHLVRERTSELDRANRDLHQAERRLRLVIDSIPELVAWKGRDGRYQGSNLAFAQAVGRKQPEDLVGLEDGDLFPVPETAESFREACRKVMDTDEPQLRDLVTVVLPAGPRSFEINRIPLHDHDGKVSGVLVAAQDVTERREDQKVRERLEVALHQAQRLEAVGKLAGGIAHDFNNLLTVIAGHVALLDRRVGPDPAAARDVARIGEAVERATALTRQILAFSRGQVMQPRVLDLNRVLTGLAPLLSRLIGEDIELATHLDPGLRNVTVDPAKIEQVIMNLAVNARDAMPGGGRLVLETANVELEAAYPNHHPGMPHGPYVMLVATDTGAGMAPDVLDHVFEPFFTTKPAGQGTGLGLATVYGIVKQSGGDVWVYSEPGKGTTFKIYLPATSLLPEAPSSPVEQAVVAQGSATVLLVEDELALRDLVVETLREGGYTVIAAAHADEALEFAAAHVGVIDLLLTDVVMPGQSGPVLARRLLEVRPGTRVVFMSGYTANTLGQQGVSEQDVLEKPFTPSALLRMVESVLKGRSG